jgi:hypothetical protein
MPVSTGFDPNATFDTSSLYGPAALDQSLIGYINQFLSKPPDFTPANGIFSSLMAPTRGILPGPGGAPLDPRQSQETASETAQGVRGDIASQNLSDQQSMLGLKGKLTNNYAGTLNNVQSLINQSNAPLGGGPGGIFGGLLGAFGV